MPNLSMSFFSESLFQLWVFFKRLKENLFHFSPLWIVYRCLRWCTVGKNVFAQIAHKDKLFNLFSLVTIITCLRWNEKRNVKQKNAQLINVFFLWVFISTSFSISLFLLSSSNVFAGMKEEEMTNLKNGKSIYQIFWNLIQTEIKVVWDEFSLGKTYWNLIYKD